MILGTILFSTVAMAQNRACPTNNHQVSYYNQQTTNYQNSYYKQQLGERLQNQKARIADGIRDGSLTAREADTLRQREVNVERSIVNAWRTGYMSQAQFTRFENELEQISNLIYNTRHNAWNTNNTSNHNGYGIYNNNRSVAQRSYR